MNGFMFGACWSINPSRRNHVKEMVNFERHKTLTAVHDVRLRVGRVEVDGIVMLVNQAFPCYSFGHHETLELAA